MIKDADSKFDDYSHWGYELTEKDFFIDLKNLCIKMSQCWFNRKDILQKAKEKYSKKKLLSIIYKTKKSNKRKVKELIQKLVKKRKRQDERVPKKKISASDSVQKRSVTK